MSEATIPFIDADIHPVANPKTPIAPFIPKGMHEAVAQYMGTAPSQGYSNPFGYERRDVNCHSYEDLKEGHLDRYPILYGVIQSPGLSISNYHNSNLANAMATAWNDWQVANYLDKDKRLLGSIAVNMNDPLAAVQEIRRCAANKQFCQVLSTSAQTRLLGHRCYFPVYEACEEAGLVFGLHPGSEGSTTLPTPHGWPSTYFEWHNIIPIHFMSHLNSMVCEGVFEKFPRLRLLLTEGGMSWLPHLMWRMDKNFKGLRAATPWLRELPSQTILEHVYLTTQPIEEPTQPKFLPMILEMIHAEKTLLFSSDFPHWDFDDPLKVLPRSLDERVRRRILYENALELFGLPMPESLECTTSSLAEA